MPLSGAQQFVCSGHRAYATVERSYVVMHRATCIHCAGRNGGNGREHILDAVIELSIQGALTFLRSFAVGNIASDAKQSAGGAVRISHDRRLDFDPTCLAGILVVGWVQHPVFSVPRSSAAARLGHSRVYLLEIIPINETS